MTFRAQIDAIMKIVKRETEDIRHDSDIFMIILVAPLFYAFFYGGVYVNKGEQDVPVAIVDCDHSSLSRELSRRIDASQLVKVEEETGNPGTGERLLEDGKVEGTVVIPEGFERNVLRGQGSDVTLELNTARFLVSNDMNKGITEAAMSLGSAARGGQSGSNRGLRVDVHPMFNTTETYGDFLIPAILIVILQQTFWIGISESVAKERDNRSLRTLVNDMAGGKILPAVAGKLGFYLIVFSIYAFFLYTVHLSLFSIPFRGNPLFLAALLVLFLLAVGGIGFFIASFFPRKLLALQVLGFTSYPIFLMSGYSWPTIAVPVVLRWLSNLFPMTPFLAASTRILQMNAGVTDVLPETAHMIMLAIVGWGLSAWRLKSLVAHEVVPAQFEGAA
jgi:ABC-2 type transport system permease protein